MKKSKTIVDLQPGHRKTTAAFAGIFREEWSRSSGTCDLVSGVDQPALHLVLAVQTEGRK